MNKNFLRIKVKPLFLSFFCTFLLSGNSLYALDNFSKGVVVSKNPIASQIGVRVLEEGGNAIDAAIATGYALGVVEPNGSGVGGGGFALLYLSDSDEVKAIDFRERAPLKIKSLTRKDFLSGPKSSGIPGVVKGFEYLRENYGTKNRVALLEPVIELARKGFPVNKSLQKGIAKKTDILRKYPASQEIYLNNLAQRAPVTGELLRQTDLAKTLEKIKSAGSESFYSGELADLLVEGIQAYGGIIDHEDLAAYQVKEREPICTLYHENYQVCSFPPPSSGAVSLIEALNILENFRLDILEPDSLSRNYYLTESLKFAFADRLRNLGDPDFNELNFSHLLSKSYARALALEIERQRRKQLFSKKRKIKKSRKSRRNNSQIKSSLRFSPVKNDLNSVFLENRETTHYTVVDKKGNIAAVTLSLNGALGSAFVVPGTGILLNNTLNDFSFPKNSRKSSKNPAASEFNFGLAESSLNYPEPLKTPLSSMSPTIIFNQEEKRPILALGAPGGPTIISAVLNVLVNYIDHKMSLERAVSTKRLHHQWRPDHLYYEEGLFSSKVKELLRTKHNYFFPQEKDKIWKDFYWSVQAVELDWPARKLKGVSDPRAEQGLFYESKRRAKKRNSYSRKSWRTKFSRGG